MSLKSNKFTNSIGSIIPRWLEMVSPRGFRWNTLICKLESLEQKLEELGILEVDGRMTYISTRVVKTSQVSKQQLSHQQNHA